ncbi:ATPase family AAA domain-containing protein 2-like [Prorops nasuta]|uniref:ATPase family AAA domain-containing protein 2-like n=1 Tax=Prorops nasuta TaxID=863751 RepID=UPI0034CD1CB4
MSGDKDFSCIGGLEKHIRIVKEMVLFPLLYGDVYAKFNLKPPRGLLFYGPPGTGKTLVASALAVECSSANKKVSFISRKGSDCLSKWVGESEKKLQTIFTMAQQTKPCIIFFDEIDGLAPTRSSKQDFVHASLVTTLLALMDGLDNNSEIVVIGATNRIDAIDPALRRPGRFDRELYFPLPCFKARKEILSVHIKHWKQKPAQKFLAYLASQTVGFCGSDLQALCAEAVMCCVRRNYPQIYNSSSKHHINDRQLKVGKQDFLQAQQNIVPASHRVAVAPIKSLSMKVQPLLQNNLTEISSRLEVLCPPEMLNSESNIGKSSSKSTNCPRILLCGNDDSHTRHLGPALLHNLEHLPCHILDVTSLFEETGRAAEESIILKMKAARRSLPSLLYVPDILSWWSLVDEAARVVFTSLIRDLDRSINMLIITTATCASHEIPPEIAILYDEHQGEVFEVRPPESQERRAFFIQLFNSSSDGISEKGSQDLLSSTRRTKGRRRVKNSKSVGSELIASNSKTGMRKECIPLGEGPPTKRQKMMYASNSEKLSAAEVQELLHKIVKATEMWTSHQLESLYASLELTLEKSFVDVFYAMDVCLTRFSNVIEKLRPCEINEET